MSDTHDAREESRRVSERGFEPIKYVPPPPPPPPVPHGGIGQEKNAGSMG